MGDDGVWQAGPLLGWLRGYDKARLRADLPAGLSLAAFCVPESLAYATLAGLAPVTGLYCYLAAGIGYALFGSRGPLVVGPTSSISILLPTALTGLALHDPARYGALAAGTALLVGAIAFLARLTRAAQMAFFISDTILLGFRTGAALYIATTQLPKLFGLPGGSGGFFPRIAELWRPLPQTHGPSLAVGLGALALFLLLERIWPRRPTALVVLALALVASRMLGFEALGVATAGAIPPGLPPLGLPAIHPTDFVDLLPTALACFFLGFVETSSTARSFARRGDVTFDPDRELIAIGAANALAGLAHAAPVSGGLSQTAVNDLGGATSPMALLVKAGAILLILLFFTDLISGVPEPVLAAVVLVAARHLVGFEDLRRLGSTAREELAIALLALLGVLVAGVLNGVLIAAIASLVFMIARLTRPDMAVLGLDVETGSFVSTVNRPQAQLCPGALVLRSDQPWLYFNAETARRLVLDAVARDRAVRLVVLDFSPITTIDPTAATSLEGLAQDLAARNIALSIANLRDEVAARLRSFGIGPDTLALQPHLRISQALAEQGFALPD